MADLSTNAHNVSGRASIVDEDTIPLDDFSYNGTAPAVYPYLGVTDTYADFLNGVRMIPQPDRAFDHESLLVTLPQGQSLSGFEALSIWCETFQISFTSNSFPRAPLDFDVDGDIDRDDTLRAADCLVGPDGPLDPSPACSDTDTDASISVDLRDVAAVSNALTGAGIHAQPD